MTTYAYTPDTPKLPKLNAPADAVVIKSPDGAFVMYSSGGNLRLSLARAINDARRTLAGNGQK